MNFLNLVETNIFNAIELGDMERVRGFIFNGGNINAQNDLGECLLLFSIYYLKLDIIRFLVGQGARQEIKDLSGHSPQDFLTEEVDLKFEYLSALIKPVKRSFFLRE